MSTYNEFNVTIYRDSLCTPWGFRLEGGKDFYSPLQIQRVFTGSPASVELQRGDIITTIHHKNAASLTHQEANDLIRNSGGSVSLGIRRPVNQYFSHGSAISSQFSAYKPITPIKPSFNRPYSVNYSPFFSPQYSAINDDPSTFIRSRPIDRPKDPKPVFSQTGSPLLPNYDVIYGARSSVKRYRPASTLPLELPRTNFSNPAYQSNTDLRLIGNDFNLQPTPITYHDKKMVSKIHHSLNRAAHTTHAPMPVAHPVHNPQETYSNYMSNNSNYNNFMVRPSFTDSEPAWRDSLKTTGAKLYRVGYKQSKTQPIHQSESYEDRSKSPKPKVVNLQYNTPIGLYSREAFNEELNKQVGEQSNYEVSTGAATEF